MTTENFQVDLRGIVEILSHHLYSSPRVYVRELIQNARDALVARERAELPTPQHAATPPIELIVDEAHHALGVRDTGIGLSESEARQLLSTIGASSKRGEFAQARRDYLGQFGIGLLSCFLVADQIEVFSRSAKSESALTMHWVGSGDGTFRVTEAPQPLPTPGTLVWVRARPEDADWVQFDRVELLARQFAQLLPVAITVRRASDPARATLVSQRTPAWQLPEPDAFEWCERTLGTRVLTSFDIEVPAAGVRGRAFISADPNGARSRAGDVVYSAGMFVADDNTQLVPDWAVFARVVLEAGSLPLTASREALQDTALVKDVRAEIGRQLRASIESIAAGGGALFQRFIDAHGTSLLAMAVDDDTMLQFVARHYAWETSAGRVTLAQMPSRVRYARSIGEFNSYAPLVAAQGGMLVNGGYVSGPEVLESYGRSQTRVVIEAFSLRRALEKLPQAKPEQQALAQQLHALAQPVLDDIGVALELRDFVPATMLVLAVPKASGAFEIEQQEDDPWAALLGGATATPKADPRAKLVLNLRAAAVRALVQVGDAFVRDQAVRALYLLSLLQAGQRLTAEDQRVLADALGQLVVAAA